MALISRRFRSLPSLGGSGGGLFRHHGADMRRMGIPLAAPLARSGLLVTAWRTVSISRTPMLPKTSPPLPARSSSRTDAPTASFRSKRALGADRLLANGHRPHPV